MICYLLFFFAALTINFQELKKNSPYIVINVHACIIVLYSKQKKTKQNSLKHQQQVHSQIYLLWIPTYDHNFITSSTLKLYISYLHVVDPVN